MALSAEPNGTPLRLRRADYPDWKSVGETTDTADAEDSVPQDDVAAALRAALTEILTARHLVVLAGLGTSMCIGDANDSTRAPSMASLWESASQLPKFDRSMELTATPTETSDIELLLSRCQMYLELNPDASDVQGFLDAAERLIVERCRFVTSTSALGRHQVFLRKIARRPVHLPRMELYTTNYDLAFEIAAGLAGFVVIDGFSFILPRRFDGSLFSYDIVRREEDRTEFADAVFHLSKLHGSVDWEERSGEIFRSDAPARPVLIYPRQSKYQLSYDRPFIEGMSRFQAALRRPNTALLVCGFGFHDHHIVQPLIAGIQSNASLTVMVADPAVATAPSIDPIRAYVEAGDTRITLLEATFEDLVGVIPDIALATEREEHDVRMRGVRDAGS
jgi:hypothetical protein